MMEKCSKFSECEAPFCPITKESLEFGVWYPDEPICTSQKYGGQDWIKRQRKIAKRTRREDLYYTGEMVQRNCVVGKGMLGLDPERDEKPQLERWLRNHPEKRELTEEERTIFSERGKKFGFKAKS